MAKKLNRSNRSQRSAGHYATKIIKAGALLGDSKTLLAHWDTAAPVKQNLDRFRRENLFGKASRSRIEDVLAIFRQRFLADEHVARALVVLVQGQFPAQALDRILYFHAARSDRLLYDVVAELLVPQKRQGLVEVEPNDLQRVLLGWVAEGKAASEWSEPTTRRVVQGLLSTLRDFGVLEGAINKRIAAVYLPTEAFAYIAFYLKQREPSGARVIAHPDWKLFFLPHEGVERFLVEAHQRGLLEYHAAGSVIRIDFPSNTLEEYAHVLAQRAA